MKTNNGWRGIRWIKRDDRSSRRRYKFIVDEEAGGLLVAVAVWGSDFDRRHFGSCTVQGDN